MATACVWKEVPIYGMIDTTDGTTPLYNDFIPSFLMTKYVACGIFLYKWWFPCVANLVLKKSKALNL